MNEEMKVKNVLILEDNKSTQELLKNIFSRLEIHSQISVADSAKDAYVLAVGGFYDLFVVDVVLDHRKASDVSGMAFVERIREIEYYKLTPVIFITGLEDPKFYAYSQLHCYSYLEKPFDFHAAALLFTEVLKSTRNRPEITENFYFRKDGILYSVETRKIVYIEIQAKKNYLHCVDGTMVLPYVPLADFTRELDPRYFLQCNRSTVVNRRFISAVDTVNNYVSLKKNFGTLDIGRVIKQDFLNRFRDD